MDPQRMLDTINAAGFKPVPGDVRLTVTGKAAKRGEALLVVLDRMKTPVEIAVVPHTSSPDTAPHLARHVGEPVQVEGYWQADGGSGKLALTAIKVQGKPTAEQPE